MNIGVTGSGSWATALVKILTDNGHRVHWWIRQEAMLRHIQQRRHNPSYLPSVNFDLALLQLDTDLKKIIAASDTIVVATPSAYLKDVLEPISAEDLEGKNILSAVKGILPEDNVLLNYYLESKYGFPLSRYFAVLGPCHAEEVAAEKLSYLTFSGADMATTTTIADCFTNDYINTVVNHDILGVQYAAVLKNIYAVGAGIAHGLEYGDNFLSVYIANAADEMAIFLRQFGAQHIVVGEHEGEDPYTHRKTPNYAASVYLGDLLVTCYSLYSRNRTFGNMIGKGYSVKSAVLEMNMVAEGYNAAKCIHSINQQVQAPMVIAETIYRILWEGMQPEEGFREIEGTLV